METMKNRMKGISASVLLVTVLGLAATASATPITFSEYPVGTVVSNQYASEGVTFLPGSVTPRLPQIAMDLPYMPTSPVLRPTGEPTYAFSFQGDFWMQFTVPVGSIDFASGSWDGVGDAVIRVYDPSNHLVGTYSNTHTGPESICISGLGPIGKVYFNSVGDFGGAGIDNLSFTTFTAVPAPGALLLAALGAGVIGWLRRRRALV
jgi:hypothetical protein